MVGEDQRDARVGRADAAVGQCVRFVSGNAGSGRGHGATTNGTGDATMLKGVLVGLLVLVLSVFAYIGYSIHTGGRASARDDVPSDGMAGGRARTEVRVQPTGPEASAPVLPSTATTGDGNGMVAQGGGAAAGPATDSIVPNPPNGMTFGGSGHFQLYRQGDLTWRLNTDTGQTCVIFATDEEWRKPKVFKAGCRGR